MFNALTVIGFVLTVIFGAISMFQFIRDYGEGKAWRERAKNLVAVKRGLMQLRAMLTEAGTTNEAIKTPAAQQFIRSVGHHVMSIEHHIDGMLELDMSGRREMPGVTNEA